MKVKYLAAALFALVACAGTAGAQDRCTGPGCQLLTAPFRLVGNAVQAAAAPFRQPQVVVVTSPSPAAACQAPTYYRTQRVGRVGGWRVIERHRVFGRGGCR